MFKGRFTKIKELSERRRLPRLGKIRLGVKLTSEKSRKEYPKETEFFVVPPEVARVYGERPISLDVMVPINDPGVVFPQAYKWYGGQRGLKCIGGGETALRLKEETQGLEEIPCPCERLVSGECQKRGHFMAILPRINMGGVYQIDIGSYNSIVDINSGLDLAQVLQKILPVSLGYNACGWITGASDRFPLEKMATISVINRYCQINS